MVNIQLNFKVETVMRKKNDPFLKFDRLRIFSKFEKTRVYTHSHPKNLNLGVHRKPTSQNPQIPYPNILDFGSALFFWVVFCVRKQFLRYFGFRCILKPMPKTQTDICLSVNEF